MIGITKNIWISTILIVTLFNFDLKGQELEKSNKDKSKYHKLYKELPLAPDKVVTNAVELIEETRKQYNDSDFEFFITYIWAAQWVAPKDHKLAIQYLETAIELYKRNPPTSLFADESFVQCLHSLSFEYITIGLYETAEQILEKEIGYVNNLSNSAKCQFYLALSGVYLNTKKYERVKYHLSYINKMLNGDEQLYLIKKSEPKWKKEMFAKRESIQREGLMSSYYTLMSSYYQILGKIDSANMFSASALGESKKLKSRLEKPQMVGGNAITRLAQRKGFKRMKNDPVYIEFKKFSEEIGGEQLSEIIKLFFLGNKEEALKLSNGLIEKAYYYLLLGDLTKSETLFREAIDKFDKYPHHNAIVDIKREMTNKLYVELKAKMGDYLFVSNFYKIKIESYDKTLTDVFPSLSESEKKAFYNKYAKDIDVYLSALLLTNDKSGCSEVLNRTIKTKGLIMRVIKEQNKMMKNMDETVKADIHRLHILKKKLNAFTLMDVERQPEVIDSLNYYSENIRISENQLNKKLGTVSSLFPSTTWKDLRELLKTNEAYVEIIRVVKSPFFPGDSFDFKYWALLFDNTSIEPNLILLGDAIELERGLKRYQNSVRFQLDDNESYDLFWKALSSKLKTNSKLYFSGDGVYNLINPMTLKNPINNKYVIDEIDLTRLLSGQDMVETKQQPFEDNGTTMLIGNPNFTMSRKTQNLQRSRRMDKIVIFDTIQNHRSGLQQLPGTEKEVNMISNYAELKSKEVIILKGDDATELRVKQIISPTVLHFATHGVFNELNSDNGYLNSSLLLAGAGDDEPFLSKDHDAYEDGFLTAYEVTEMELSNTNLVVLSACETGIGEVQSGQGVWGLQRAFQMAGARNVIGSLWKIDDGVTARFMDSFYKLFYSEKDVENAYKAAITQTRMSYSHPYYWGAFILYGNH